MFDEKFITAISNSDIQEFNRWITFHGVKAVVANSGKKSSLNKGKDWLTALMYYGQTLHKWAVSDLCSEHNANYVFEHMFSTLILYDDKAELAQKCGLVFSQKMFGKPPLPLWANLISMVEKNQTGLLQHIFSHDDFQKHLTSSSRDARNGMENFFKTTIVSSRNNEENQSWWRTFRNNMPEYHNSWLTAYINALMYFNFDKEAHNIFNSSSFLKWDANNQFLKYLCQNHTLAVTHRATHPEFLNPTVLPMYYGQMLWNTIALNDKIGISSFIEARVGLEPPFEQIVLSCLQSAERAVKGLKSSAKQKALDGWRAQRAIKMVFDALDEDMIATLMPYKNDMWDRLKITEQPYILAHILQNEVGAGQRVNTGRKL